ncbi:MAG TPA: SDR family oxidoreductase [Terriglobales bacterium]|nr:SDR family oxidoreductase [Terriglobales bacterium]
MNMGLKDRVAMVAASSAGLGRAVAEGLAAEGAHLALCSRSPERIEAVAAAIRQQHGVRVWTRALDVTDPGAVAAFVEGAAAEFGRLDVCVTNAGGPPAKPFATTTIEEWQAAVNLNLLSHVCFAKHVLPHMQRAGWGRFLMISSVAVKQPIDGLVLSNTVRGAVPGLVRTLANEYGPYGILVNNVCPGYTLTERLNELAQVKALADGVPREAAYENWSRNTALRRLATPQEFADAVVYLASERASYITGQSLLVDGGFYKGAL